jgi:hypothetical protein
VLAAAGYNFSLLLRWFEELLRVLSLILWHALLAAPLHLTRCRKTFFTVDDVEACWRNETPRSPSATRRCPRTIGCGICCSNYSACNLAGVRRNSIRTSSLWRAAERRAVRQNKSKPLVVAIRAWFEHQLTLSKIQVGDG